VLTWSVIVDLFCSDCDCFLVLLVYFLPSCCSTFFWCSFGLQNYVQSLQCRLFSSFYMESCKSTWKFCKPTRLFLLCLNFWHQKESLGCCMALFVRSCGPGFSYLCRAPTCDRQTDKRTHDDSIYHTRIASRDKKRWQNKNYIKCDGISKKR